MRFLNLVCPTSTGLQQHFLYFKLACQASTWPEQVFWVSKPFYKNSRLSAVFPPVKTDLLDFYKPSTGFVVVKTAYQTTTSVQQTGFAMVKMYLPNINKPATDCAVVKTCSTILHTYSKGFAVVKRCITIHYRCWTGFAAVKSGLPKSGRPSTSFVAVKTRFLQPLQAGIQQD